MSVHFVSTSEAIKGISNRFLFSTFYIYLYLIMAGLSLATVIVSLLSDCPTLTFYILEIIVNTTMIVEVSIRLVAFGNVGTPFISTRLYISSISRSTTDLRYKLHITSSSNSGNPTTIP
jgi:hypothetical protein